MLPKVWIALALLSVAQSQTFRESNKTNEVEEKLDTLNARMTAVEEIVENRTRDVLKLRDLEEKFRAVEDRDIKNFNHRLDGVEGVVGTSTPQLDHLGSQVEKLWGEIRDIRNYGAVPKEASRVEVSSNPNAREEEEKPDSRNPITDTIANSTEALSETLINLNDVLRESLSNSLHDMSNSNDELLNELSVLQLTVREALSNYTDFFRSMAGIDSNTFSFRSTLMEKQKDLGKSLRVAFAVTKNAITKNFRNLKRSVNSELSNLAGEINNSRVTLRKDLRGLNTLVTQAQCN